MNYTITSDFLHWKYITSPERVQLLMVLLLVADDDSIIDLSTPDRFHDLSLRTSLPVFALKHYLADLRAQGILDAVDGFVRIAMPDGICGEQSASTPLTGTLGSDPIVPSQPIAEPIPKRQSSVKAVTVDDFPEGWWQLINTWLEYKRKEKRGSYKNMTTLNTFYKQMLKMTGGNLEVAQRAVAHSMANTYMGLVLDPADKNRNNNIQTAYERNRNQARATYLASETQGALPTQAGSNLLDLIPD